MSFRSARLAAGLSVRQVIEKLKVTDAAVYMWETGTQAPRASRLPEIAELYGCTVDELLKKEDDKRVGTFRQRKENRGRAWA